MTSKTMTEREDGLLQRALALKRHLDLRSAAEAEVPVRRLSSEEREDAYPVMQRIWQAGIKLLEGNESVVRLDPDEDIMTIMSSGYLAALGGGRGVGDVDLRIHRVLAIPSGQKGISYTRTSTFDFKPGYVLKSTQNFGERDAPSFGGEISTGTPISPIGPAIETHEANKEELVSLWQAVVLSSPIPKRPIRLKI